MFVSSIIVVVTRCGYRILFERRRRRGRGTVSIVNVDKIFVRGAVDTLKDFTAAGTSVQNLLRRAVVNNSLRQRQFDLLTMSLTKT